MIYMAKPAAPETTNNAQQNEYREEHSDFRIAPEMPSHYQNELFSN